MKQVFFVAISCCFILGCRINQSEYDKIKKEHDDFESMIRQKDSIILCLRDTISMLSYPASQRFGKINSLVANGDYDEAKLEMEKLVALFPESKEAKSIPSISTKIDNLIAKQKADEERRKSLGFKGLKSISSIAIDYNKVSFSNLLVGNTFVHDAYDDSWFYNTADRGNVYFTAAMQVTSSSKDPNLPTLAVYSIKGETMNLEGIMRVEFARWKDYGHYLGNYHDNSNDFAKTSTIRFKLGVELSDDVKNKPYAIILKKSNDLSRHYDRYENPPVSYRGRPSYPYSLSLDDFTKQYSPYVVVKIANL